MTNELSHTDVIFDVFAGIGPFAIPATKKRATVYANDLNPYSYENLLTNIKLNKCDTSLITCSNLDGREFINTIMKDKLKEIFTEGTDVANISNILVLMNLPALAYTFLDAFYGILSDIDNFNTEAPLPTVNCYCFTNLAEATEKWEGDTDMELKHRVMNVLKGLHEDDVTFRYVRNVAPQKQMMCASFKLTQDIMCGTIKQRRRQTEESQVTTGMSININSTLITDNNYQYTDNNYEYTDNKYQYADNNYQYTNNYYPYTYNNNVYYQYTGNNYQYTDKNYQYTDNYCQCTDNDYQQTDND